MQATVHLSVPISDKDLERISQENPGWKVEREGRACLIMSPTSSAGSAQNTELTFQLAAFAKRYGGKAFDSSGGFTLPDRSVLSADGAWIRAERWAALTVKERNSYAPIVPDVWIELRSQTDRLPKLFAKLRRLRSFGASYVLMIDPYERTIWHEGNPPLGFALDFEAIYDA